MKTRMLTFLLALACAACGTPPAVPAAPPAPVADHHQHLFSPAMAELLGAGSGDFKPLPASELVALLDAAGIRRAVILSGAYIYGGAGRSLPDEYARVRAENDWAGAQAAQYPGRLRAFCGLNPLKDYALAELARCAADPRLRHGIKLHFGNSDVRLEDPRHVALVAAVFRAANEHRMAIAVHMRASISRQRPYGAQQAQAFLDQLLPMAPDVAVQVAHLAGAGPGYDDPPAQAVMAVLAQAVERGDPRTRNLWFDVASIVTADISAADAEAVTRRLRQVGMGRVLYGSDAAAGGNARPREAWAAFCRLPLTRAELARIAGNLAPYLQ